MDNIEILSKRLRSLQITNKISSEINKWINKEMFMEIASAITNNNIQTVIPKSIVLDPGWFDGD